MSLFDPFPSGPGNPFSAIQSTLVNEMYPPFAPDFNSRTDVLFAALAYVIALSFLYFFIIVRDMKVQGRQLWFCRVVERPAGRYIVMNQYTLYPTWAVILASCWILYVKYMRDMFGGPRGNPTELFMWISFMWIPLYVHLSTITYAVIACANLATRGSTTSTHILSPVTSNCLGVVLLPCILSAVFGSGVWSGIKWRYFGDKWQELYNLAGSFGAEYNGTPVPADTITQIQDLARERMVLFMRFKLAFKVSSAIYIVSAVILVLVNLAGFVVLVRRLRQLGNRLVPRDTTIVAPLKLISTGSTGDQTIVEEEVAQNEQAPLRHLEWDVTLFFLAVLPASVAFIAYAAWLLPRVDSIVSDGRRLEFACIGMMWIYTFLVAASLTAMVVKSLITTRKPENDPAAMCCEVGMARPKKWPQDYVKRMSCDTVESPIFTPPHCTPSV